MMKLTAAVTLILAAAVGVSAQSGGSMKKDTMAKPMAKDVTYTGCVTAGAQAGTYTLTGATEMTAKAQTMSKDAMGKDMSMPMSIMLMGTKVDLSKYMGHKISVTGTMEKMDSKMDTMAKPGIMPMGMMVTSMKMMSATCGM